MEKIIPLALHEHGAPSDVEHIKIASNYLRGSIAQELDNPITGGISAEDNRLMKFHGSYLQDDRDVRYEREQQRLEPLYQFMVRVRIAGGILTPAQWLQMDHIASTAANGTLRITTRQALQLHGVLKWNMRPMMRRIHDALLTTIAACGDVNRNVMCSPTPYVSDVHADVYAHAQMLSDALNPQSRAYHEIFLDGEKIEALSTPEEEIEPLYGPYYLPRKFKIGFCVPPTNDIDVFSQDLGFIAIQQDGALIGYNVVVGGGMGMSYGDQRTYPQLAKCIGFVTPECVHDIAWHVIAIQRDYGHRAERKLARMKYTIDRLGLDWFVQELSVRMGGRVLEAPKPYAFAHNADRYGWIQGTDGLWYYTVFVENGRICDDDAVRTMSCLRAIAQEHTGDFRLTPNQNVVIGRIADRERVAALLTEYGVAQSVTPLRMHSIACVALPTCGLAMAESERAMPHVLTRIEALMAELGLADVPIVTRMTGCPNGCARPFLAEIAFTGRAVGKYNVYLGGDCAGRRLNVLYREQVPEADIVSLLRPLLASYAQERMEGEPFGDFVVRKGHVPEVTDGRAFHQ